MGCKIDKTLEFIDSINEYVGKAVSFLMVLLTLIVILEVFMRYAMNNPTIWGFETTQMVYGSYFMLSAGYALLHNSHVSVDFFVENRSERGKAWLIIISYCLFFFPFVTILLIEGTKFAAYSWSIKEHSWSVFGPPLYPYKTVIPVTAFLLLIAGTAKFVRTLQVLLKKEQTVEVSLPFRVEAIGEER